MEKQPYHVLFLEDEPTIREVLKEYMLMSGYRVTEAKDGDSAIALLREQDFDIAVLDIMVPGIDGFGVPPIIVLKRMETILRRTLKEAPKEDRGLTLKEESYRAFYNGQPLPLTLSEYLLLQTLYREPERVFTREQLILRIYNEDYIGNDRIIDAHVKNMRKKLPVSCIKTVIGVGYQFDPEGRKQDKEGEGK